MCHIVNVCKLSKIVDVLRFEISLHLVGLLCLVVVVRGIVDDVQIVLSGCTCHSPHLSMYIYVLYIICVKCVHTD